MSRRRRIVCRRCRRAVILATGTDRPHPEWEHAAEAIRSPWHPPSSPQHAVEGPTVVYR